MKAVTLVWICAVFGLMKLSFMMINSYSDFFVSLGFLSILGIIYMSGYIAAHWVDKLNTEEINEK